MDTIEPTVKLKLGDVERRLRWTGRSDFRLSSMGTDIHATVDSMKEPARILYALCLIVFCGLHDRENLPYAAPEDIAEHLRTVKQQHAAMEAVREMLREAGHLKTPGKGKEAKNS